MDGGLRERKKRLTRQQIADAAARLFAERSYEQVSVIDVARAALVSEQTVYNYFPTKGHLVLELDDDLRERLRALVRTRPAGVSPAAAIRLTALELVDRIITVPPDQARGRLGYLAAVSPPVRRLCLEMTDRHADAIAAALLETGSAPTVAQAKVQAVALAWVFQTITDETGRRMVEGQASAHIVEQLRPLIEEILGELDRGARTGDR